MTTPVTTKRDGAVFEITLDRPKANAINVETSKALYAAFAEFRDDSALSVAILSGGEGRFFSAGWDLKAGAEGEAVDADHGPGGFAGLTELWDLDKPVIAAVNGLAFGGGFELALAADLIIAADTAEEIRALYARIMELLMTARRMLPEEAARWWLVNKVVPKDQLLQEARALAATIAANAPLALKAIKAVIQATMPLDVKAGYTLMRSGAIPAYTEMLRSEDALEGPHAFAEKRKPKWKGR